MKKIILLAIFFSSLFFIENISAQDKFHIEANAWRTQNFPGKNELSYWPDGWTAGIGLKYALTPKLEIGVNGSYSNLQFDKDKVFYAVPTICCYRYEVIGNNTKVYETAISAQFSSMPNFFIKPYFTFRLGLYFFNTGEVYINSYSLNSLAKTNGGQNTFGNSGKSFTKSFAGAGFGLSVNLTKSVELRTQLLINITFDGSGAYWPEISGINFGF